MGFNFRKIASVIASAVMFGGTIGMAAAASYPEPFISGGAADVAIVYGSSGAVSDLSAAIDVQSNLQGKVTASSSGGSASSSGGDSVNLASTSQKIYMNSGLNSARTILTEDHLPTILADASTYDLSGTEYKYTQTITPNGGNRKVTFSKSGESVDPDVIVDTGYQASSAPLYNYTLSFTKTINVSSTDIIGVAEVTILGKKFTTGANSDYNTLYLYGSGSSVTVDEGETKTVTVDGTDHTISLIGTSSTSSATVEVDGVRKTLTAGNSYKFADGFEVYFKDLFHATKTGTLSSVDLLVGSKSLHFENGQAVRYGTDDTTILGTHAVIAGTAGSGITQVRISQAAESSLGDFLKTGESYTDRIFGNLVLENVGPVPPLDSDTRDIVSIETDNAVSARVTFTSALAGSSGETTINYARDSDNTEDGTLTAVNLAYENNYNISIMEGENMKVQEYFVVADNDEGRILRLDVVPYGSSSNDYVRFTDVITGESFDFTTGLNNKTTAARAIGGGEYHVAVIVDGSDHALSTVNITWGAGSAPGYAGTQTGLFPRIKLKNGGWLSFLRSTTVYNTTTYALPGKFLLSEYKAGTVLSYTNNTRVATNYGNINYSVAWGADVTSGTLDTAILRDAATNCSFTATLGPTVLYSEEKTLADSNGHTICVPLTSTSGSTTEPAIGTPKFSDGIGSFVTLQSNTYKTQAVSLYGTLVEKDTSTGTNNKVMISYPNEQMFVDVFFKSSETTITPGEGSGTGGGTVLIVKDTEINSVKDKNLVVIGGSCVNTVARKIVDPDATAPICGPAWTSKTNVGAGQYLLKAVESPYNEDKTAMMVAGFEAPQTVSAAGKLKEGHATDVGTENIYPTVSA